MVFLGKLSVVSCQLGGEEVVSGQLGGAGGRAVSALNQRRDAAATGCVAGCFLAWAAFGWGMAAGFLGAVLVARAVMIAGGADFALAGGATSKSGTVLNAECAPRWAVTTAKSSRVTKPS
jgi:hypothetical protein